MKKFVSRLLVNLTPLAMLRKS